MGESIAITPNKNKFIMFDPCIVFISNLVHENIFKVRETVRWRLWDSTRVETVVEVWAYYVPQSDVRLFSPQA